MCSHDSAYVLYKHDIRAIIDVRVVVELKLKGSLKHTMTVGLRDPDTSSSFSSLFSTTSPHTRKDAVQAHSAHIINTAVVPLNTSLYAYM